MKELFSGELKKSYIKTIFLEKTQKYQKTRKNIKKNCQVFHLKRLLYYKRVKKSEKCFLDNPELFCHIMATPLLLIICQAVTASNI